MEENEIDKKLEQLKRTEENLLILKEKQKTKDQYDSIVKKLSDPKSVIDIKMMDNNRIHFCLGTVNVDLTADESSFSSPFRGKKCCCYI